MDTEQLLALVGKDGQPFALYSSNGAGVTVALRLPAEADVSAVKSTIKQLVEPLSGKATNTTE